MMQMNYRLVPLEGARFSTGEETAESTAALNAAPMTATNCGTVDGAACSFPFIYKGINYTSCSSVDSPFPWCRKDDDDIEETTEISSAAEVQTWQACVDELLDPTTALGRRQALLADLVNANGEIREDVLTALRERNIDPLLTPTGKKLQDGTRAVARQITNDILPSLARSPSTASSNPLRFPFSPLPKPEDVSKVGSRVLNALGNQVQKNLETLQDDLADPTNRIPQRLSKQREELVAEAKNIFSETPVGLNEPSYVVVKKTDSYEIRDYEGYKVAATSMGKGAVVGDAEVDYNDVAAQGAAFNTLASYLFGSNKNGKSMAMTTPVTTTSWGEMRFFLDVEDGLIPDPLDEDDEGSRLYETNSIEIMNVPAARLAVRRFTGFVTEGEVTRQKDALLTALELDNIELDAAHGETISHVIFQYNPPYTIPMVRRNEIGVPVRRNGESNLEEEWGEFNSVGSDGNYEEPEDDVSPSDG